MADILTKALCYVAIIVLGYVLRRRGVFGPGSFEVISTIVVKITMPCAIISATAGKPINLSFLTLSLLGFGGGVLYMAVSGLVNRKYGKRVQAFAILNTPGYAVGTFTLPFAQGFLGDMGVMAASLFDVGNAFICLGGAYSVAAAVQDGQGFQIKRMLKALLHSTPFLAHLTMVCLNLNGLMPPRPVLTFAEIIGGSNAFLSMLMIGVGFHLTGDRSQTGTMARILLVRYGVGALLGLCYFFLLPFPLEMRQALVILAFSPIGAAVPGFTAELKSDVGLSSALNSVAIVISIVLTLLLLLIML